MKNRELTIRTSLSISFMLILVVVFIAFGLFYGLRESNRIQKQAFELLSQNALTLSSSVDDNISQMDMVSLNILYSNLIRVRFSEYIDFSIEKSNNYNADIQEEISYVDNIKILGDMLTAIIGPQRPVEQINIFSLDQGVFATGLITGSREDKASDQVWYDDVMRLNGEKILTLQHSDTLLSKFSTDPENKDFLSLTRIYFDIFNNPQGIVEVKKPFNKVISRVNSYSPIYGESIYVIDENGTVIYPISSIGESSKSIFDNINFDYEPTIIEADIQNKSVEYLIGTKSAYTGFTTVIVVTRDQLLVPIYENIRSFLFVLIAIMLCAYLLTYYTAHQITKPVHNIYTEIRSMDFDSDNYNLSPDIKTRIAEFTTLYDALLNMQNKLHTSVSNQLLLKNKEMQSKMLALQSQMNPHFLFNSLSTIQAMSEEKMNQEIIQMCQTTSNILRYISSDKEQTVSIKKELHHTIEYLKCMQIRYDNQLFYETNIPQDMDEIKIPKLCIQLLVENSIKFSAKKRPPWKISITGEIAEKSWQLSVRDNGTGFSEDSLQRIEYEIKKIDDTGLLPSLELNGMGLLNIYLRLKLLYPNKIFFKISNAEKEGAVVTIGGRLK